MSMDAKFYCPNGISPEHVITAVALMTDSATLLAQDCGLREWGAVVKTEHGAAIGHDGISLHTPDGILFCWYHANGWKQGKPYQVFSFPGMTSKKSAIVFRLATLFGGLAQLCDAYEYTVFEPSPNVTIYDPDTDDGYDQTFQILLRANVLTRAYCDVVNNLSRYEPGLVGDITSLLLGLQ